MIANFVKPEDVVPEKIVPGAYLSETNGLRSRIKYRYEKPDGRVENEYLIIPTRAYAPYGASKYDPTKKKDNANQNTSTELKKAGAEWTITLGTKGIQRDREHPGEFKNADEYTTKFFKCLDAIDAVLKAHSQKHVDKMNEARDVENKMVLRYKSMVRTQLTTDANKPVSESQHVQCKLQVGEQEDVEAEMEEENGKKTKKNYSKTTFRKRISNDEWIQIPFEEFLKVSKKASLFCWVCVASTFAKRDPFDASAQARIVQVDVIEEGVDPKEAAQIVFDGQALGLDYGPMSPVNFNVMQSMAPQSSSPSMKRGREEDGEDEEEGCSKRLQVTEAEDAFLCEMEKACDITKPDDTQEQHDEEQMDE